jgi:hypothetical protein
VGVSIGLSAAGIVMVVLAFLDPEPTSKLGLFVGAGAVYIFSGGLSAVRILEGGTDTVVYRAPSCDYFHTDTKAFPAVEFLVELLQHLPDSRRRLIRAYGLYSSRGRGTWSRSPSCRCRPGTAAPHGPA